MALEYIIYCDESDSKGRHYSNFYGGALIRSDDLEAVKTTIAAKKLELNLFGEIKWSKVSRNYYKKYIEIMDCFFDQIEKDKVKIRIMFTHNMLRPRKLTDEQIADQYFILYYWFVRHAFGLNYSPILHGGARIRVYPDTIPNKAVQVAKFKQYVANLTNRSEFWQRGLSIVVEDVTEVISHDHDILQCLDVVLGSMNFRLNDKHRDKPTPDAPQRSAKTIARHKVYKHINKRIRQIYPNFNIGISTGHQGNRANRWNHPYRHWLFRSKDSEIAGPGKRKKSRGPETP